MGTNKPWDFSPDMSWHRIIVSYRAPKQQKTMISPRENDDLHRLIVDV